MAINLLEALPVVKDIIAAFVPDPNRAREMELELAKLELESDAARYQAIGGWLSNKSWFVSGAIPATIWTVVAVVIFNCIFGPLLTWISGRSVPILDLPGDFIEMVTAVIVGLFTKKVIDAADISIGKGGIHKKAKPTEAEEMAGAVKAANSVRKTSSVDRDDPEYHKKRYEELLEKYRVKEGSR